MSIPFSILIDSLAPATEPVKVIPDQKTEAPKPAHFKPTPFAGVTKGTFDVFNTSFLKNTGFEKVEGTLKVVLTEELWRYLLKC